MRVVRLEDGQVDLETDVAQKFREAVLAAHDPEQVGDVDVACAALIEPLVRAGWWELAIQLAWPDAYLPPAPFHAEALAWWSALEEGVSPPAFIACWPRDGGKSTHVKQCLALATGVRLRPYMMWISKVGNQVNDKVRDTGTLLKSKRMAMAFPEAASRYIDPQTGMPMDWREGRIRTGNDVVIDAGGMDQAMRGALVRNDRPGIIVLDDLEDHLDTKYMREKKLSQITDTIIPMGSDDVAVLFVQNRIHQDSLMSSILSDEAEWLADRVVSGPWPQIRDMEVEWEEQPDGRKLPCIVGGTPTWVEGRGFEASEKQMRKMGPPAFRREHNHDMTAAQGDMFLRDLWGFVEAAPDGLTMCRAWDLAASEGETADWTVGALMGVHQSGRVYVLDVVRGRWLGGRVEEIVKDIADQDRERFGRCQVLIEKQPAAAGKVWNERWEKEILATHRVVMVPTTGGKVFRADGYSAAQQKGLLSLVVGDWNGEWVAEHALFTSSGTLGKHDDQVDAGSQGFNWLTGRVRKSKGSVASAAGRTLVR